MFVMTVNDLLGTIHATVANFDGIPVEYFPKFVIFRKVFIYYVVKFMSDISIDIFAEGRLVPEDVVMLSFSLSVGFLDSYVRV